ncbi:MAG: hypothetical protein HY508_13080 [Acidobacteria bacterium]|nr:hypothetical protein [Acidobacteriota bacterium]
MTMRKFLAFLSLLIGASAISLLARPTPLLADEPKDRGVFILKIGGKQMGTETFEIVTRKDAVEASAKIDLRVHQDGKSVEFKTSPHLVLTPDLNPVSYEWSQKGAQSSDLQVDMRGPRATAKYKTVTGAEDVREFELPPGLVILDNNVIHHYQIAVLRYRRAGGGKKTFRAFIPQEALPGALEIEDAGPDRTEVGGRDQLLEHLVMTTDNARIDLWIDGQDRLQKLAIPAAQLEVFRKK